MRLHQRAAPAVLTVVAVASWSWGVVSSPALAAPGTCQGKAVTIVATTEVTEGTEGDDVVAMKPGGWSRFDALGGNDTVCLAEFETFSDLPQDDIPFVDAGAGDDEVVNLSDEPAYVPTVVLGLGSDTFVGAATDDSEIVYAETEVGESLDDSIVDPDFLGPQRDVVTSAGTVYSSAPLDGLNNDRITFGTGQVRVVLDGPLSPDGLLDFANADTAALWMRAPARWGVPPAAEGVIDNGARTVSAGPGPPVISWSGTTVTDFHLASGDPTGGTKPPTVSFIGTDAAESVWFADVPAGDVALGGGRDELRVESRDSDVSVRRPVDGGADRDVFSIYASCGKVLEVRLDRSVRCDAASSRSFTGFEEASLGNNGGPGSTTRLVGTSRSDRLDAYGHSVVVRGGAGSDEIDVNGSWAADRSRAARISAGAGDDRVSASGGDLVLRGQGGSDRLVIEDSTGRHASGAPRHVALGGQGNDVLTGSDSTLADKLVGGPGRDRADGGEGRRDFCSAEKTRRCERF